MSTTEAKRRMVWDDYSRAWSPVEPRERARLLEGSLHAEATYRDPNGSRQGREAIAEYMADTQTRVPGATFRNQSVLQHADRLLAHWVMLGADGAVIAPGVSFARFEGDRLIEMNGFFPTPAIAS